jgi:hypothetical protein
MMTSNRSVSGRIPHVPTTHSPHTVRYEHSAAAGIRYRRRDSCPRFTARSTLIRARDGHQRGSIFAGPRSRRARPQSDVSRRSAMPTLAPSAHFADVVASSHGWRRRSPYRLPLRCRPRGAADPGRLRTQDAPDGPRSLPRGAQLPRQRRPHRGRARGPRPRRVPRRRARRPVLHRPRPGARHRTGAPAPVPEPELQHRQVLRLGYTEDEIGHGGADRIVDDLVFWGDLETITAKLRQHADAGADHVGVQVIGVPPGESAMPNWRDLAGALL